MRTSSNKSYSLNVTYLINYIKDLRVKLKKRTDNFLKDDMRFLTCEMNIDEKDALETCLIINNEKKIYIKYNKISNLINTISEDVAVNYECDDHYKLTHKEFNYIFGSL
jgi:hypothetical protein